MLIYQVIFVPKRSPDSSRTMRRWYSEKNLDILSSLGCPRGARSRCQPSLRLVHELRRWSVLSVCDDPPDRALWHRLAHPRRLWRLPRHPVDHVRQPADQLNQSQLE